MRQDEFYNLARSETLKCVIKDEEDDDDDDDDLWLKPH